MSQAYQGQGYGIPPGQGHGADPAQLCHQQQQQMYNMRAGYGSPHMGALPRQPYPAGQQYGLADTAPRFPMFRPSAAASAGGSAPSFSGGGSTPSFSGGGSTPSFSGSGSTPSFSGGSTPSFSGGGSTPGFDASGAPAPVHHHLRNSRSTPNPQLVADSILHMASATYPCNGPQVIPPGVNKFPTATAGPRQMMAQEVQMAARQPTPYDMNHMSPGPCDSGLSAAQMWANADAGQMPVNTAHQMSGQQDGCYGNQFHYSSKPAMMSPDMMSPDGGGHMIRSPPASVHSGHSVASGSPVCSPAQGSICSPHTDQSPASVASPVLRSPAGQAAMMHGMQSHQYVANDQYAVYPAYNQPSYGQPVTTSVGPEFGGVHQSNPLQSLQQLVMLPESQVINPKSVVSEACLNDEGRGPAPGKRKRCTDGVHCGSEDDEHLDRAGTGLNQSFPNVSYFHDASPSDNPCGKPGDAASESPTKSRKRKPKNKKAKVASEGQAGGEAVFLAPNLNCTPVAGTGQPDVSHYSAEQPDSVSVTHADVQNAGVFHCVASDKSCEDLPDRRSLCPDTNVTGSPVCVGSKKADSRTSTGNSPPQSSVKNVTSTKKSRSKKLVKSPQAGPAKTDGSAPHSDSLTKETGVEEGTWIGPERCHNENVLESSKLVDNETVTKADDPVRKQECEKLGCGLEVGDAVRKSVVADCGKVECDSVVRHSDTEVATSRPSIDEPKVMMKNTATCSANDNGKTMTSTSCPSGEEGKLKMTDAFTNEGDSGTVGTTSSVLIEESKVKKKRKRADRKVKPSSVSDSVVRSSGMVKCADILPTANMSSCTERTQMPINIPKSSPDSPRHSSLVGMSSPKPMRPQQVDLTKIGKDISGKLGAKRLHKNFLAESVDSCEDVLNEKKNGPSCDGRSTEAEQRTERQTSEHKAKSCDDSKVECLAREVDQKPEPIEPRDSGTFQTITSHQKNAEGANSTDAKHFVDGDSLVKTTNNGVFKEKSNSESSVARSKRKRPRNIEKQTRTNVRMTPTKQSVESLSCSASKSSSDTAEVSAIINEDGTIHVKRESTTKVYGRSPDKKNSGKSVETVSPSGELPSLKDKKNSVETVTTSPPGKVSPSKEASPSDVAETQQDVQPDPERSNDKLADGATTSIEESLQNSGRGKRKRVPNRYFNFGGEVVWWEVPTAFKRKRLNRRPIVGNNSKTVNRKEPRRVAKNSVGVLRKQKADVVNLKRVLLQDVVKRTKNGVIPLRKSDPTRVSVDDELPLSAFCKKKPVATVLPLNSVHADTSVKCMTQKQMKQLEEKDLTRGVPPTCVDIVTLMTENGPIEGSYCRIDGDMEVEEVEEEEYVLCPDTCQTLDLFVPDSLDTGSSDRSGGAEVIDCDSDTQKPRSVAPLADVELGDETSQPPERSNSAIYVISSDEELDRDVATPKAANDVKDSRATAGDDDLPCADVAETVKRASTNKAKARCKARLSRGGTRRKKKSKRSAGFDYDDDSADERLKNHLTKTVKVSQSGKGGKSANRDTGSLGTQPGPYVRLKGCKETPTSCTVVSLATDELEKVSKQHSGKSQQKSHKHCAPAANLSYKLIDSEPFVCVFCANGSCYETLNDLFGPYHPEGATDDVVAGVHKRRASDDLPVEMWVHEDCAVWSSGVYLVGSKLHGLDEAVSVARQTVRLHTLVFLLFLLFSHFYVGSMSLTDCTSTQPGFASLSPTVPSPSIPHSHCPSTSALGFLSFSSLPHPSLSLFSPHILHPFS